MTPAQLKVVLLGAAAVIVFDLLASLASRQFGFAYVRASIGSYLIYLAIGFFAARASPFDPIGAAATAAAIAGLTDASIGWAVSWVVGPGKLPDDTPLTIQRWLATAFFVVALAAVVGAVGGVAGRRSVANVTAKDRQSSEA